MMQKTFEELIIELYQLAQADTAPFPYDGCRKVVRQVGGAFKGLVPDLNTYFMDIAGYASWGRGILKWPKDKRQKAKEILEVSFFEKHLKYKPLEPLITEDSVPDLYATFKLYEKIRLCLLKILSQIQSKH